MSRSIISVFALSIAILALAACGGGGGGDAPPPPPTGFSIYNVSSSQINIYWNQSLEVDLAGYNVYRDGALLRSVVVNSASDIGLAGGTQYCYQVTAFDLNSHESTRTAQLCTTTYASSALMNLPDTGQTGNYSATFGEDSDYTIYPPSYTVIANTVADNVTHLIWQRCSNGQGVNSSCTGSPTGYNWYQAAGVADATYNPCGAANVCASLTLDGHSDWRLPSKKEMFGILSAGTYAPAIYGTYFPNTSPSAFWTVNSTSGDPASAWAVDFNGGDTAGSAKSGSAYARCVRGSGVTAHPFTGHGDGTVTDGLTGLMWQKCSAGQNNDAFCTGTATTRNWDNALSYCEALFINGYGDWRLPNAKELESLSIETANNPAVNSTSFPATPAGDYWSSTAYFPSATSAWTVNFADGSVSTSGITSTSYYTRCVR